MRLKKKYIIALFIFIILAPVLPKVTYSIDSKLISNDIRPIFSIGQGMAKDGGTTEYRGLGYQIIRWNRLVNDGIEYGYEIYKAPNYRNLNDGPTTKLTFIKNQQSGN